MTTLELARLPRVAIRPGRASRPHFNRVFRSSRWGELNPPTPVWRTGVSPQHFTCLAVSHGDLGLWIAVGARSAFDNPYVGREGIEPSSRRIKSPLQSQRLLPTHRLHSFHPLELNQNLSGFSRARRPLRQGGMCAPRASSEARTTRGAFLRVPARAPSSSLFDCQRWFGPRCAGRTSGREPLANLASAPFAN